MKTLALTSALALATTALGETPGPIDKSGFSLLNPVPREAMREMSTDRPDQTESAYTVDAGHWQVELDLVKFTSDRADGVRTEIWNVAPVNVKVGLTNHIDLQMVFDSYSVERVRADGGTATTRDWGDLTLRLKGNLWGNDGGTTAFALMPFVKFPLEIGDGGDDLVEGGLIAPLAVSLPGGWGLGLMSAVGWLADGDGGGHHAEWVNTVTLSHDLTEKLGGYVEFVSVHTREEGAEWAAQVDAGLTYAVSADLQLDLGCNVGVTDAAPDVQPFLGMSIRF